MVKTNPIRLVVLLLLVTVVVVAGISFLRQTQRDADPLAQLKALTIDLNQIDRATELLTQILTTEVPPQKSGERKGRPRPQWNKRMKSLRGEPRLLMQYWGKRSKKSSLLDYVVELYEEDAVQTRKVIHYLANYQPYLLHPELLFSQAAHDELGASLPNFYFPEKVPDESKAVVRKLFSDDHFFRWARSRSVNLRQYLTTYTVVGMYDWISYPDYAGATGFDQFPKNADVYYDLGGGYATPDISRLIGKKMTSVDVISPRRANELGMIFHLLNSWMLPSMRILSTRPQTAAERDAYGKELNATPWLPFDVYKDKFPTHFDSYFFTSFGFLSSTVENTSDFKSAEAQGVANYKQTSYFAARRILELVAQGKKVDVFTYSRPTNLIYKYLTAFFSFRDQRLVETKLVLTETNRESTDKILLRK